MRVPSVPSRAALLALLAIAMLVVRPVAGQRGAPGSGQGRGGRAIEMVDGRPAAERDILVKFRRALGPGELTQIAADADADETETVGSFGVIRLHSRSRGAGSVGCVPIGRVTSRSGAGGSRGS